MPIPDFEKLIRPVLALLADGLAHQVSDLRQKVAAELNLSDDELAERLPSGYDGVFSNRTRWAI
jgi:restriction system protein